MAINGQVELLAADLTMTVQRSNAVEFTVPFMSARNTVLLKKERRHGRRRGSVSVPPSYHYL